MVADSIPRDAQSTELGTEGVDQRAVDAAIRFLQALDVARRSAEQGQWINEHPIRSALNAGGAVLLGHRVAPELRSRLVELRKKSIEAYEFSSAMQRHLSRRYPLSTFAMPFPPDVQPIDELLEALQTVEDELWLMHDMGRVFGVIARLFIGG